MKKLLLLILLFSSSLFYSQALPSDFLIGEYEIITDNGVIGPDFGTENFETGMITVSGEGNARTFDVGILPAFNSEIETVVLNFSQGRIQIGEISPGISCTAGISYIFSPTDYSDATPYNLNGSDEYFEVFYTEDIEGSCGGPFLSSFTIAKSNVGCYAPSNVQFSNPTASSIDISWVDPNDSNSSFTIIYGEEGFDLGSGNVLTNINNPSTTIDSLENNTTYEFYLQTNCGNNNNSDLVGPFKHAINPDFYLATDGLTCECPEAEFGDVGSLIIDGVSKTFTKRTEVELRAIIGTDVYNPEIALTCTTGITDMSSFFEDKSEFNQNISSWDVSNVIDMSIMFYRADAFNQPLNNWNVSRVTNMDSMFSFAEIFNQPLNNWDVSNVNNMLAMFSFAYSFNQSLNNWDVSNITNMGFMFSTAYAFNQPLNNWDVSNVENMEAMFSFATSFNQPLNNWDVSNVTNISRLFSSAQAFNQPLYNWNMSNVTNMRSLFSGAYAFNQPLNNWDVSNVENMIGIFASTTSFDQPLNNWDVSSVTDMSFMFSRSKSFNQPLGNWDVSNVTDMREMFSGAASFDQTLTSWSFNSEVLLEEFLSYSGFSQENYDTLLQSFESQSLFNINLGAELIGYCDEQTRERLINEKGWTIEGDIFALCDETLNPSTSPFVTTWTVSSGDLNVILNIPGFYDYNFSVNWGDGQGNTGVTQTITHNYAAPGTYTVEIIGVYPYFSLCESPSQFCDNARKLSTVESWGDQEWQLMHSSFKAARNFTMTATDIPDLSQVSNMSNMFYGADAFNQPLNNWDVSSVTDMSKMFRNSSSFNQPLSNWDVSSVTDMSSMLHSASSFNQFLDNWDVSNVNTMNRMFAFTPLFNQPLNSWDVSNVTDMFAVFAFTPLFNQPLSNWDVSSVTDMSFMFIRAESFNQPLDSWDVSLVINMYGMFQVASSYNQPLSNWDVSSVVNMDLMFKDAETFNQDISTWCVDQIPTEPIDFSLNSLLQDSFKPIWGTCEPLSTNQVQAIDLTLFPNPVSEKLFVDFQSSYNFQSIKIFDMLGREVKALNPDRIQEGIEVSGMNTGSYLIQFMTQDKQQLTKRFIIK